MKNRLCHLLVVCILVLGGLVRLACAEPSAIKVIIEETPWAVIENNGVTLFSGADVSFQIKAAEGFALVGTDYRGETAICQEGTQIELTLKNVLFPTRVKLLFSSESFALHYEPNGGEGAAFTEMLDKKSLLRPNAANAQVAFTRPGYTLTGWNTRPDGSGTPVGLGSRVTVEEAGIALYAQWAPWTDASCFSWMEVEGGAAITGCTFDGTVLVIPAELEGLPVVKLSRSAFALCRADTVIFPETLRIAEDESFSGCAVKELVLFDSIEQISDACFPEGALQTLHINAAEAPAGAAKYKESCYADKLDLLILSQDRNRIVFYGGCSMWYNLEMNKVLRTVGDVLYPVNLALNGTVNSELQLQMMLPYLHEGDWFFHTPELSSDPQMLRTTAMGSNEGRLWAGLEYNYDLLAAADLTKAAGILDSLCAYLNTKTEKTAYTDRYKDSKGRSYMGTYGEIPFGRYGTENGELGDQVVLNTDLITADSMQRLGAWYALLQERGLRVFVSYACLNLDALIPEERSHVHAVNDAFAEKIGTMPGVVLLSDLMHFTYHNGHFFDTNYHLLSEYAVSCTNIWMKALKPYVAQLAGE